MKPDFTYYPNSLCPLKKFLYFFKKSCSYLGQFLVQRLKNEKTYLEQISYINPTKKKLFPHLGIAADKAVKVNSQP